MTEVTGDLVADTAISAENYVDDGSERIFYRTKGNLYFALYNHDKYNLGSGSIVGDSLTAAQCITQMQDTASRICTLLSKTLSSIYYAEPYGTPLKGMATYHTRYYDSGWTQGNGPDVRTDRYVLLAFSVA